MDVVDELLPDGGLRRGTIVEWLTDGEGTGVGTLVLKTVSNIMRTGGAFVVIDSTKEFYPAVAIEMGIDLDNTIIVRPSNTWDGVWAFDQSLRCPGVAVSLCLIEELNGKVFRQLQLAAKSNKGVGLLLRSMKSRPKPSWADVRLLVQPLHCVSSLSEPFGRRLRVEVLRCRRGANGGVAELEISDETGLVRMASQLAHPTHPKQATRA